MSRSTHEKMEIFWQWFREWGESERRVFLETLLPKITPNKLFALTETLMSSKATPPANWRDCSTFTEQLAYFHACLDQWSPEEGNRFLDYLEEIDYTAMSNFYDKIAAAVKQP